MDALLKLFQELPSWSQWGSSVSFIFLCVFFLAGVISKKSTKAGPLPATYSSPPQTSSPISVEIGDGNIFSNSPVITGDNNQVRIEVKQLKPIILSAAQHAQFVEQMSGIANAHVQLVCIGKGRSSLESVKYAFEQSGWSVHTREFGMYASDKPTDLSQGVHVMEKAGPAGGKDALLTALTMAGISYEEIPWANYFTERTYTKTAFGNLPSGQRDITGLFLIIGDP